MKYNNSKPSRIKRPFTTRKVYFWQYKHNPLGEYLNLAGKDLRYGELQSAKFIGADLRKADFRYANLYKAHFIECDLRGAVFSKAILERAQLVKCNVKHADFIGANMREIAIIETSIKSASITSIEIPDIKFWSFPGDSIFLNKNCDLVYAHPKELQSNSLG